MLFIKELFSDNSKSLEYKKAKPVSAAKLANNPDFTKSAFPCILPLWCGSLCHAMCFNVIPEVWMPKFFIKFAAHTHAEVLCGIRVWVCRHNFLGSVYSKLFLGNQKSGKFPYISITILIISNICRVECTNSVLLGKLAAIKRKWIWNICHPLEFFNCDDLCLLSPLSLYFRLLPIQISQPTLSSCPRYSVKKWFFTRFSWFSHIETIIFG